MPRSYGFLSTFPPTRSGVATFTSGLIRELAGTGSGDRVGLVRILDAPITSPSPEVVQHLHRRAPGGHRAAADALNTFDAAVVLYQHGIYGGQDGDQLLSVLDEVRVPVVLVTYNVLPTPTLRQRSVLERAIQASNTVVMMTEAARDLLVTRYTVDAANLVVIPHGSSPPESRHRAEPATRPVILTWGLLRPGKGIGCAIDAMQRLGRLRPAPAYVVAGVTDPWEREHNGEAYRLELRRRVRTMGVASLVRFVNAYLEEVALSRFIDRAGVVVLPYDPPVQATSEVLTKAVAAGKPVVATPFPHATEMLAGGAGILVPAGDAAALGEAIRRVLTEPGLAAELASQAARLAPGLQWPAVAHRYRTLLAGLPRAHTSVPR